MPSDRSLDEFAGADDGADDEDTGDDSEDVNDSDTEPNDSDIEPNNGDIEPNDSDIEPNDGNTEPNDDDADVNSATPTAAWSTEDTCDRCGEPTQRSWYEDGALVCAGCKSW